jgi:hypothetical protein
MTRKDYELIAAVLTNYSDDKGVVIERDAIAYRLADALAIDNPRFNRKMFLVAAGVLAKCDYCKDRATSFSANLQWCAAHRGKGLLAHARAGATV